MVAHNWIYISKDFDISWPLVIDPWASIPPLRDIKAQVSSRSPLSLMGTASLQPINYRLYHSRYSIFLLFFITFKIFKKDFFKIVLTLIRLPGWSKFRRDIGITWIYILFRLYLDKIPPSSSLMSQSPLFWENVFDRPTQKRVTPALSHSLNYSRIELK